MQSRAQEPETMPSERDRQPTVLQTQFQREEQGRVSETAATAEEHWQAASWEMVECLSAEDSRWEDSWELVECPSAEEVGSQPLVQHPQVASGTEETAALADSSVVAEPDSRLFSQKKTVEYCMVVNKEILERRLFSCQRFYTSGGSRGYLMEMKFSHSSTTTHQNDVRVHIYVQPGKNDGDLCWPLRATVLIELDKSRGRLAYSHRSSITGTWEKPGTQCVGELSVPYKKLQADGNGMLYFKVRVLPE